MFACEEIPQAANDNAPKPKRIRSRRPLDRNKNAPERVCLGCQVVFKRKGNIKDAAKYCSRACALDNMKLASAANREYAKTLIVSYSVARCICTQCGSRFIGVNLNSTICSDECMDARYRQRQREIVIAANDNRPNCTCKECGTSFVPMYGEKNRIFCSRPCSTAFGRKRAIATGLKAANRLARKMLERAATVEIVNPLAVLERDGWRCQLCRAKTPKRLRGTQEPNAPELDHIIPLSVGGEHSYRNTQCLCRSCNSAKSNNPLGQLRLFG